MTIFLFIQKFKEWIDLQRIIGLSILAVLASIIIGACIYAYGFQETLITTLIALTFTALIYVGIRFIVYGKS